jgi:hypothetical protein
VAIAPESQLLNEQYVQLLQRVSFKDPTPSIDINAHAYAEINSGAVNIAVPNGQAVRVVKANYLLRKHNASVAKDILWYGLNVQLFGQAIFSQSVPIRSYSLVGNGSPLGVGGVSVNFQDDDLIAWTDYAEVGGIPPGIQLEAFANVENTTAGILSVDLMGVILVEFYSLKASGHVGYP